MEKPMKTPRAPRPSAARPPGHQALSASAYAQIREAIQELVRPQDPPTITAR